MEQYSGWVPLWCKQDNADSFDQSRRKGAAFADSLNMGMGDYIFSMLADNESEIEEYLECDTVE